MDSEDEASVMTCCKAAVHPWDRFSVATEWLSENLHCLVIGESPGNAQSVYFYDLARKVAIRTIMLRELYRHRIITKPSLPAFRGGGFLFDHAIRCLLTGDVVKHEANLANRYESRRATAATHLVPFLQRESPVWVMGRIARNAVATFCHEFPRDKSEISKPPYPCRVAEAPRFFVSRYLLHASGAEVVQMFTRLHRFLDDDSAARCAACNYSI